MILELVRKKPMANVTLAIDFYLEVLLIAIEAIILGGYVYYFIIKRNEILESLISAICCFLLATVTILLELFFEQPYLQFFSAFFGAGALASIVVYLEMFENEQSFTKRSTSLMLFILTVGALKGGRSLFGDQIAGFISFITPILYIIVGAFYVNTVDKIKERVRFENQKRKIRKIKTGVYLTFIFPKFISGSIFTLGLFSAILFKQVDISKLFEPPMTNIFEVVVKVIQLIGLIIMTLPIVLSRSSFFMQSRKVSELIVINKAGESIFDFSFEQEQEQCDEVVLNDALKAISTLMNEGTISCQELKTIQFGDQQIMTEIRESYAVNLLVDRPTKFLDKSLESFAEEFKEIYSKEMKLDSVNILRIKIAAEKIIQKSFGLAKEEFEEIKRIVRTGYDKVAEVYLETRREHMERMEEMLLIPELTARLPENAQVLDAGCGSGIPITKFLSQTFEVTGVDISPRQIELAKQLVPKADFYCHDVTEILFPDNYLDGIICYHVMTHIPREEQKGIITNFYRMLKSGGIILINFGLLDNPGTVVDDYFGVKMYWSSYDVETNLQMMKDVGFDIIWSKQIFDKITDKQHQYILAMKEEAEEAKKEELTEEEKEEKPKE
ncbi:MAG: methyltransferase domain-containing protein [Candidatus Heimdallarchaeota archaeon]|nr:methyltransferase domain-containing protein [Candidatus Heimdallarchaeota archaeon]